MLPKNWKPVACADLIRLGSVHDGGYVVSARSIDFADTIVSMGLNDDWKFEEDIFARTKPTIICFDHTVTAGFWKRYVLKRLIRLRGDGLKKYLDYRRFFGHPTVEHRQLMIGYGGLGGVSLDEILTEQKSNKIFLKADIEGWEYRIFDGIIANQHRLSGMVLELHDVDLHRERIDRFLRALDSMSIVCLHANNYGGTDKSGDPIVLEICLMSKSLQAQPSSAPSSPAAIRPNSPQLPDIELQFAD
jgi:hypothetical protein